MRIVIWIVWRHKGINAWIDPTYLEWNIKYLTLINSVICLSVEKILLRDILLILKKQRFSCAWHILLEKYQVPLFIFEFCFVRVHISSFRYYSLIFWSLIFVSWRKHPLICHLFKLITNSYYIRYRFVCLKMSKFTLIESVWNNSELGTDFLKSSWIVLPWVCIS